jgi:hypothetical protein
MVAAALLAFQGHFSVMVVCFMPTYFSLYKELKKL